MWSNASGARGCHRLGEDFPEQLCLSGDLDRLRTELKAAYLLRVFGGRGSVVAQLGHAGRAFTRFECRHIGPRLLRRLRIHLRGIDSTGQLGHLYTALDQRMMKPKTNHTSRPQ